MMTYDPKYDHQVFRPEIKEHKMVTTERILVFEVSIDLYWGILLGDSIQNDIKNPLFLLGIEI